MTKKTLSDQPLVARSLRIGYRNPLVCLGPEEGLDFALTMGTFTAIVGVNGVGKSTLLRTLAGMQPALSGEVELLGKPLEELDALNRAYRLSVVLTEPPASRNLRVKELVRLGRYPYTDWIGRFTEEDRLAVGQAIRDMALEEMIDTPCHTLSDGQLQRVMIARALSQSTPVILLDEPTTHLDLYHKVRILKSLKHIAEEQKKTVVLTTHEIDLAIQLCSHILVLQEDGYAYGTPSELIAAGAFNKLFPQDTVTFDKQQRSFRVKK